MAAAVRLPGQTGRSAVWLYNEVHNRRVLVGLAAAEAIPLCLLASAAGGVAGVLLAGLFTGIGPAGTGTGAGTAAGDAWPAAAAVALGAMLIMVLPALTTVTPGTARARRGRQAAVSGVTRAGADLALGSGPHLWRAMELYQGRLIAYSMGNFSTWETFGLGGANGITGVLNVTLAPNGVATAIDLTPAVIEKPGKPVPDPEGKVIARVRGLSKDDFGKELLDEHGHWSR